MQKTQNKSGHSPSTRENILIFHQNPLQHPISALSASHVIIYCEYVLEEWQTSWNNSIGNELLDIKPTIGEYQSVDQNIRKEVV